MTEEQVQKLMELVDAWAVCREGDGRVDDVFDAYRAIETFAHSITADVSDVGRAAHDVFAERQRQISAEGWTPEHDDTHGLGELSLAAACYALPPHQRHIAASPFRRTPTFWPWSEGWWKPTDRRRDLVKAGALILAEIERLDRNTSKHGTGEGA